MNLEALLEPTPERITTKEPCKVGRHVAEMPADIQQKVSAGLAKLYADGGMTDEEWADRFKRAELPVSATVINRHRKGRCNCA